MSNIFAKYRKELSGVKVVSKDKAFVTNKKGNSYPNPNYDIVGKVDISLPNVILKANRDGFKTFFIEDTSELTKKTKSDLINFFYNKKGKRNNRKIAYLVRTDNKSKTDLSIKKQLKTKKNNNR